MAEPIDIIIPMLQNLQADMSDLKRGLTSVETRLSGVEERLNAYDPYITFTMGLHTQVKVDVEGHTRDIAALKARVAKLEGERGGTSPGA